MCKIYQKQPVVFFLVTFFFGSVLLVELLTMPLHHIEKVPEECNSCLPSLDKETLLVDCSEVDVVAGTDKLVNLGFTSAKESRGAWNVKEFGDIL